MNARQNARRLALSALILAATATSALAEPLPGESGYPQPVFTSTHTRAEVQAGVGMPEDGLYLHGGLVSSPNPRASMAIATATRQAVRAETSAYLNMHRGTTVSAAFLPY